MGKITYAYDRETIRDALEEIESQLESLRQEIQDLKDRKPEPESDLQRGILPPEQWEAGDVLCCINYDTGQIETGIFHHLAKHNKTNNTADVEGYWSNKDGLFSKILSKRGLNTDKVIFRFRPEK